MFFLNMLRYCYCGVTWKAIEGRYNNIIFLAKQDMMFNKLQKYFEFIILLCSKILSFEILNNFEQLKACISHRGFVIHADFSTCI